MNVSDEMKCGPQYPTMKIEEGDIRKLISYLEQKPYIEVKEHIAYLTHVICSIQITGGVK